MAEDENEKKEEKMVSFSGEVGAFTSYYNKDTGERVSKEALLAPVFTLTHNATEAYISIYGYFTKDSSELDVSFGKLFHFGKYEFDLGVSYYNPESLTEIKGDFVAAYVGVKGPKVWGFVPAVYIEAVSPLDRDLGGSGVLYKISFQDDDFMEIYGQSFGLLLEGGGNNGVYGSDPIPVSFLRGTISTKINVFSQEVRLEGSLQDCLGGIARAAGIEPYIGLRMVF
ncbi:MAG: hypothetical protein NTY33_00415 [Candidatus Moranbacteria bacterium]|nr:hypothetical protein [Candidatus Moranbacteria bacterium]